MEQRILVGVTGASGAVYAERLVDILRRRVARIYLVFSETALQVVRNELKPNEAGFSLVRAAAGELAEDVERAADVCLKQKRPLLLCPRETPLSTIHLRNMLALAEAGAHLIPAMPAFYQHPKSIQDLVDFHVGKVLEALSLPHELYPAWNSRMR
jgi:4-hydroxy-3-polyprenylbenzoate decarboxylase